MSFSLLSGALGLAQFAPVISKWLGGEQAEQAAQDVLALAKQITGQNDPNDMIKALKNDPELIIAFQKAVIQLETELEVNYLQDRQDARSRDISLITMGRKNFRADIMVICAALGLISCLGSLSYYAEYLPGEAVGIISTIAGIFGACLKDAYAFEFGSSRGSKEKDNAVATLLERGLI